MYKQLLRQVSSFKVVMKAVESFKAEILAF